jgi:hypothetical protein
MEHLFNTLDYRVRDPSCYTQEYVTHEEDWCSDDETEFEPELLARKMAEMQKLSNNTPRKECRCERERKSLHKAITSSDGFGISCENCNEKIIDIDKMFKEVKKYDDNIKDREYVVKFTERYVTIIKTNVDRNFAKELLNR